MQLFPFNLRVAMERQRPERWRPTLDRNGNHKTWIILAVPRICSKSILRANSLSFPCALAHHQQTFDEDGLAIVADLDAAT
jgi:hypothetical protein